MTMRLSSALMVVMGVVSFPVCAHGAPVCDPGRVGELVCKDAEAIDLDRKLNQAWKNVPCSKEQKASFVPEQLFWLRQRDFCGSADDPRRCLLSETGKRIEFLKSLRACDDASRAMRYPLTDAWYVLKNPKLYINTDVDIFGFVSPDSCRPSATSTGGTLWSGKPGDRRIHVVFKSLPADERSFLCDKQPGSHWHGTVKDGVHGMYLYLDNILGKPLP